MKIIYDSQIKVITRVFSDNADLTKVRLYPDDVVVSIEGEVDNSLVNKFYIDGEILTSWQRASVDIKLIRIRHSRGSLLASSDALVTRHRDQLANGETTTLSAEEYTELLNYRKALRDFPENVDLNVESFNKIVWPTLPSFMQPSSPAE